MHSTQSCAPEVTLESKVAFLRHANSLDELAYRVEAIETHLSWVFLTGGHAYKLKKPVVGDLLDFRTVAARHYYCDEELRLNRRLAPDIYIGLVPLSLSTSGHLQLGPDGAVVDWLVKMHRVPARQMLDYGLRRGTVVAADIVRIAARLTAFYRNAASEAIAPGAYRERLSQGIEQNLRELSLHHYRLPLERVRSLCRAQHAFVARRAPWFDERVHAGRIVEGHGDLRPEHVRLAPSVAVIDCLEFARALRIVDPADELGFLALECERLGEAAWGELLLRSYSERSGDCPPAPLVHFYQGYRATVRARIAVKHLDEEKFRYSPAWRLRTLDYLRLAQLHQGAAAGESDAPP